jgi:protein-S-isoprenylcysteine O-methyltransferase Ste14
VTGRPDNPGIHFPPPLIYLCAVIGGALLDRQWPLAIDLDAARNALAWMLLAVSVLLSASSVRLFQQKRTSVIPVRPASALVTTGPYRFTRNPMYVGLTLLTTSVGLFLDTLWPILLLMPALRIVHRFVIVREEHYLHRRFGAEYDAYTRQVRRWL